MPKSKKPLEFYLDGIHHIDCLEGMKQLPDESIDRVITSPPYADMRAYEGGFEGFHPDNYVAVPAYVVKFREFLSQRAHSSLTSMTSRVMVFDTPLFLNSSLLFTMQKTIAN